MNVDGFAVKGAAEYGADAAPPTGAFGRVEVGGAASFCRFVAGGVELLDRPAWERDARVVGEVALAACRLLAPTLPRKVLAVGLNYRAHAEELCMELRADPILFLKPSTAVVGPGEAIVCPSCSNRVDYEAELAVVVGRRCKAVSPSEAAAFIAGYTCANDVTARDLQQVDGQWTRAKGFDTFCPLGPWVVEAAPRPGARVSARLDGAEVQHGFIEEMIFTPLELLAFASGVMTLEPGDVVLTGTPPGIGPLAAGQVVCIEIEGVGGLVNPVV